MKNHDAALAHPAMRRALLLGPLALALVPAAARATGVAAGTLIQGSATATYTSGAATGTVESNTVTVKVDELLDVAVTGLAASPISTGSAVAVLPYSVTNTGNGDENFVLTANAGLAGNPFDPVVQSIVIDSNGNGTYDAGTDTVVGADGKSGVIAPDATLKVFVLVKLPANATDAATAQVRLTAEAVTGTGAAGTTFAGAGTGGSDAVTGLSGGGAHASDSLTASLASVALVKSAAIADPFGGTASVPGAFVTYSIVANVTGTGIAEALHVTDAIPTGTTYKASSMKLDGATLSDASDADAGTGSASGIDVALGNVSGGATHTVTFSVKIN